MSRIRHPYPSDLPTKSGPAGATSRVLREARPPKWSARRLANAVFYLLRSGCAWRMLPREYPPWQTVYHHFRRWRLDGRVERTTRSGPRSGLAKGAPGTPARR